MRRMLDRSAHSSDFRTGRTIAARAMMLASALSIGAMAGVPQNPRAIPGNGIITVVWERPDTLSTFRVYRSTTSGNTGTAPLANYETPPYPQLGGLPREDALDFLGAYGDTTVSNGTTYYYQVTAVLNGTEGAKSAQVQAQPVAAPPDILKSRFLKIMPMGNSITAGWIVGGLEQSNPGGYRKPLIANLRADGYNFLLVGSCNSLSYGMDDPYHEGYGARVVYDDFPNVRRALPVYDPDLLLLTIGTNNLVYWGSDPVNISLADYRELMRITYSVKPNLFVMAAPVPPVAGSQGQFVAPYNAGIKKIVDSLKALGKRIDYVKELDSLTTGDLQDGIHPTQDGYNKMGRYWYEAIKRITQSASFLAQPKSTRILRPNALVQTRLGSVVISPAGGKIVSVEVFSLSGASLLRTAGNGYGSWAPLMLSPGAGNFVVAIATAGGVELHKVTLVR